MTDLVISVEMESLKMCKDVWKTSAEFASFYRYCSIAVLKGGGGYFRLLL